MIIREENKKILEKYNIEILDDVDEMLDFLSEYMCDNCFYPGGDPKDSCFELEKVYDNLIEDNIYNKKIKITNNSINILKKYNINTEYYTSLEATKDNVNELLIKIDSIMTKYRDENDEPLKEWLELEKVYDEIFKNN